MDYCVSCEGALTEEGAIDWLLLAPFHGEHGSRAIRALSAEIAIIEAIAVCWVI
jgi:hypothetical protein